MDAAERLISFWTNITRYIFNDRAAVGGDRRGCAGRFGAGSGGATTAGTKAGDSCCTEAACLRASRRQANTCCEFPVRTRRPCAPKFCDGLKHGLIRQESRASKWRNLWSDLSPMFPISPATMPGADSDASGTRTSSSKALGTNPMCSLDTSWWCMASRSSRADSNTSELNPMPCGGSNLRSWATHSIWIGISSGR